MLRSVVAFFVHAPRSEDELLARAGELAGRTLAELAKRRGVLVPPSLMRHKGWIGELLEDLLGAKAGSRATADFELLGVELKSLPVDARGMPSQSTFVTVARLKGLERETWQDSAVLHKLRRVLWVPVQSDPKVALPDRRVGTALLWSPSPDEEARIRADWEHLTERIRMGYVESITGREGDVLQLRPKGLNAGHQTMGVAESGARTGTMQRGYYLRASFTRGIIQRHFALPAR